MVIDLSKIKHIKSLNELTIGGKKIEDGPDEPTDYTQDQDTDEPAQAPEGGQDPQAGQAAPAPEQNNPQDAPQPQDQTPQENPAPADPAADSEGLVPGDQPTDDVPEDYGADPDSTDDTYNQDNPALAGQPATDPNNPPQPGAPMVADNGTDAPSPDGPTNYTNMEDDDTPVPPQDQPADDMNNPQPTDPNQAQPNDQPPAQPVDPNQPDQGPAPTGGAPGGPVTIGGNDGEDGPTDYTQDDAGDGGDVATGTGDTPPPQDGGEAPEGGEGEGEPQEGDYQDDGQPQQGDELQQIEDQLFSNLSPEQISIRNIELKTQYIDLYNTIDKIITRVDLIEKTEKSLPIIDFVSKKLNDLKIMVNDYIIKSFNILGYLENQINLQHYLVILDAITKILEETKIYEEKDRKTTEDEPNES